MNKKHFYTTVILLSFLAIGIQPTFATTWIIGPDQSPPEIPPANIGIWNEDARTFTLADSTPIGDNIKLIDDDLTLNGNGHTISGVTGQLAAVELNGIWYVNIQNLTINECDVGINLIDSVAINVSSNSVTNCQYGIRLIGARTCTIEGNIVSGNVISVNGIELGTITIGTHKRDSIGNILHNNTIENYGNGIYIWGLSPTTAKNQIYNNNFINNSVANAEVSYSSDPEVSIFHHNYWDGYTGVDLNFDGIGDTPYIIRADNTNPDLQIQDDTPWFSEDGAILTPTDAIVELIDYVVSLNLQNGIDNSLDAKLDAAFRALDDLNNNNDVAAINSLNAFINAVEDQRGNKIEEADADALIASANAIISML